MDRDITGAIVESSQDTTPPNIAGTMAVVGDKVDTTIEIAAPRFSNPARIMQRLESILSRITAMDLSPEQHDTLTRILQEEFSLFMTEIDQDDESDILWDMVASQVPFPMIRYSSSGLPKLNRAWCEEMECTEEEAMTHYASAPNDRYVMMRFFYRGDNLMKVIRYLEEKQKTGKGYANVAFTATTRKTKTEKTFRWITIPDRRGWDRRIGLRMDDRSSIEAIQARLRKHFNVSPKKRDSDLPVWNASTFAREIEIIGLEKSATQLLVIRISPDPDISILRLIAGQLMWGLWKGAEIYRTGAYEFSAFVNPNKKDLSAMLEFQENKYLFPAGFKFQWSTGRIDAQYPGEHSDVEIFTELRHQVEEVRANCR